MAVAEDLEVTTAPARKQRLPSSTQARELFGGIARFIRGEPLLLAFIAGGLIARIAFWMITNRMFEDGLITITHARNVPLGLGLIHHVGEGRIQGFTSALGVLIPLAGELVRHGSGMTTTRLASLLAACVALIYARFLCRDLRLGAFPTAFVLAYLAFDQNVIFYGMSGMETQVAVAVLLAGIYHVRRQEYVWAGVWIGLAQLARPEFVLWVAPALAYLLIANWRRGVAAGGISASIVAPWVIFTTIYYGSPIPNTIVAKGLIAPPPSILTAGSLLPWLQWLGTQFSGHLVILLYRLEPFREVWSTASAPVPDPLLVAIAILVVYFLALGLRASVTMRDLWPALIFLGLTFAYRVYFLPTFNYYGWYLPPFLAVLMIFVALGLQRMATTIRVAPRAGAVVLSVAFAVHMPFSFVVDSKIQAIEDQVRTKMAIYLKANVPPGQTVVSESAGYVGFYSDVKLYDYPGLTSKVSVRALQQLPIERRNVVDLSAVLQPDWLVMRPWELATFRNKFPDIAAKYEVAGVFETSGLSEHDLDTPGVKGVGFGGLVVIDDDMKFIVLKRITA